jgi:hypothetical protein
MFSGPEVVTRTSTRIATSVYNASDRGIFAPRLISIGPLRRGPGGWSRLSAFGGALAGRPPMLGALLLRDANLHQVPRSSPTTITPGWTSAADAASSQAPESRLSAPRKRQFAGKVRAGLTSHARAEILDKIREGRTPCCPFVNLPRGTTRPLGRGHQGTGHDEGTIGQTQARRRSVFVE